MVSAIVPPFGRLAAMLAALLWLCSAIAPADNSIPDDWENSPYLDDEFSTTRNFLLGSQIQGHTIHDGLDVDWGIIPISSFGSDGTPLLSVFTLQFSSLQIPEGAGLLIELYEDGPEQPATASRGFGSVDSEGQITWLAQGTARLYYRVSGINTPAGGIGYALGMAQEAAQQPVVLGENSDLVYIPQGDSEGETSDITILENAVIESVTVLAGLFHNSPDNLEVTLTHLETGVSTTLISPSDCDISLFHLLFDDEATESLGDACATGPVSNRRVTPSEGLSNFTGLSTTGTWRLSMADSSTDETGSLEGWQIRFNTRTVTYPAQDISGQFVKSDEKNGRWFSFTHSGGDLCADLSGDIGIDRIELFQDVIPNSLLDPDIPSCCHLKWSNLQAGNYLFRIYGICPEDLCNLNFVVTENCPPDPTPSPTDTPTPSPSSTPSATSSATPSTSPSLSPSATASTTASSTPSSTATPSPSPTDDHGSTYLTATAIIQDINVAGNIEVGTDVDYFRVLLYSGDQYDIHVSLGTLPDSVVWLYDIDGTTLLDSNDDDPQGGLDSRITFACDFTGYHYVKVGPYGSYSGTYWVRVSSGGQTPSPTPSPTSEPSYTPTQPPSPTASSTATATPSSTPELLPDLEPYIGPGWDDYIVVSTMPGTSTSSALYSDQPIYVDFGSVNSGPGEAGTFNYGLFVDNAPYYITTVPSLPPGSHSIVSDYVLGLLSPGTHTLRITCNYDNGTVESNDTNNSYSRTVYVFTPLSPTPSPTATPNPTSTATASPTPTSSPTGTLPPSPTPSQTPTPTPIAETLPLQQLGLGTGVSALDYSPDGRRIASAGSRGVFIWDAETGEHLRTLYGHSAPVNAVRFSPDGTYVLSGSEDHTAILWDRHTGIEINRFAGHTSEVTSVAFSPSGSQVVTGSRDKTVVLWDVTTGALIDTFGSGFHTGQILSVAVSPDGNLIASGGTDRSVVITSIAEDDSTIIGTHSGPVTSLDFSPDGKYLASASRDTNVVLWDTVSLQRIDEYDDSIAWIASIEFSTDGSLLLGASTDGTARVWNVVSGNVITALHEPADSFTAARLSPDALLAATSSDEGQIRLWDLSTESQVREYSGHTESALAGVFSPDGESVLTGSLDGKPRLYDTRTGRQIQKFTGHTEAVSAVAFSNDGSSFLTGSQDTFAMLWDAAAGIPTQFFVGHRMGISAAAISPSGETIATGGYDRVVRVWNSITGLGEDLTIPPVYDIIRSLVFMPGGQQLLIATGNSVYSYDLENSEYIQILSEPEDSYLSVNVSPDGTVVAAGTIEGLIRLLRTAPESNLVTLRGHKEDVTSLKFSPDGSRLLSGSQDKTAILWDVSGAYPIKKLQGHTAAISSVDFSSEGKHALTTSQDGSVLIWELRPPRAIIIAGGGDYLGNSIAHQTDELAAYAYRVLRARDYQPEDIQYLSAFDPRDDVDGVPTLETLGSLLTGSFSAEAGRLFIIAIDHGYRTESFSAFRLNESELLSGSTLKTWLDTLQETSPVDVTLAIDCCYSGGFVNECTVSDQVPDDRSRIIFGSTTDTAEAIFLPPPDLTSFSYIMLGAGYMGNSLTDSWQAGSDFFTDFPVANQQPQISDSSGIGSRSYLGASWVYGVRTSQYHQPFDVFDEIPSNSSIDAGTEVPFTLRMKPGEFPDSITAIVRPPAPDVISGDPVSGLPQFEMTRVSDNPGESAYLEWQGSYLFESVGQYVITFEATFANNRLATTADTQVTVLQQDYDADPLRAIIVVGEEDQRFLDTFAALSDYATDVYLDRIRDASGNIRPDWITVFTDNKSQRYPTKALDPEDIIQHIGSLPDDVARLYLHFIGSDAGNSTLRLAGDQELSAVDLDISLDAFQVANPDAIVVLVVDAPGSGSFLPVCSDTNRIVITSGQEDEDAIFLQPPILTSFSQKFLSAGWQGNNLWKSYTSGRDFFEDFLRYFYSGQVHPLLDDNGDGIPDYEDGELASSAYLGREVFFAGNDASGLPFILNSSATPISGGDELQITVTLLDGIDPIGVYAERITDLEPMSNHTRDELVRTDSLQQIWQTTVAHPQGSASFLVYAVYQDGIGQKSTQPDILTIEGPEPVPSVWMIH